MLFYQLLERLEHVHSLSYCHRDVKPENLMMGIGEHSNTLFLVDFGISRSVLDPRTG